MDRPFNFKGDGGSYVILPEPENSSHLFFGTWKVSDFFSNVTKISYCLILYLFVSFIIFNKIWQNNNKTNISPPPKSQMAILLSQFIYIICGALEITQLSIIRIQYIQIFFWGIFKFFKYIIFKMKMWFYYDNV